MSAVPRTLAARIIGFVALRDLIPFYAVYSLLFADAGLSLGEISSLFVLWSVTSVVLEVPSGAWADTVSRRLLLALSSVLFALGFALWILLPSYAGFAVGFVLWGASSALVSGTLEALVYDELAAIEATPSYAGLLGWANSAATTCIVIATLLAAPLFSIGGYALVGWVSVGVALLQALLALSLPAAPQVAEADEIVPVLQGTAKAPIAARYLLMLRTGLTEAGRKRIVRNAVLITSLVYGLYTYDEYFALVAQDKGIAPAAVALLVSITAAGGAVGTALVGRTARIRNATMAVALVVAAALFAAGAALGGIIGFLGFGLACGIHNNVIVVAEARLQDAIEGPARATVTSVSGLLTETVAIATFAAYAVGSSWFSVSMLVMLMAIPLALVAVLVPRWTPAAGRATEPADSE